MPAFLGSLLAKVAVMLLEALLAELVQALVAGVLRRAGARLAELVDTGAIRTTMTEHLGRINAENLMRAHAMVESGRMIGKVVLEGF